MNFFKRFKAGTYKKKINSSKSFDFLIETVFTVSPCIKCSKRYILLFSPKQT